jgi:hypothetical protein
MKLKSSVKKEIILTAPERETICVISDADDNWNICTASTKYKNKFEKLGWKSTPVDEVYGYVNFEVPERCLTFRKLEKKKMSQGHKDALSKARLDRKIHSTV